MMTTEEQNEESWLGVILGCGSIFVLLWLVMVVG